MRALHHLYHTQQQAIEKRLASFSRLSHEDIFYELCFCILTPQSKGTFCWEKVKELKRLRFHERSFDPHKTIKDMRFHHHKNTYLLAAKKIFPQALEQLQVERDPILLRAWLVNHVDGYGYKEASHFLRNIGYRNLAILDRHILKNLVKYGVIPSLPITLTKNRYLEIEQHFKDFASAVQIPLDALDFLFWSAETGEIFK